MAELTGRRVPLSLPRRWIDDLMVVSRRLPIITFERRMDLAAVALARSACPVPPSWVVLFVKAYAIVAARRPELRRMYMRFPWPHFYEADESLASVAVERDYCGEPAVFFGLFHAPDRQPLPQMQQSLEDWKTHPVETIRAFRRLLRYARFPWPLRRLLWRYAMDVSGSIRARNFGTFGVSVTSASGATALNLIAPLATTLNYGLIDADGILDVRLHFDHRVIDGMTAARVLAEVEEVLQAEIASGLRAMADDRTRSLLVGVPLKG